MPFSIATFRQYLKTADPHYARIGSSSLTPWENQLALGGAVLASIQPLWAVVPYAKQQKYAAAIGYLRQFLPTLADAIPSAPAMEYREFKVLFQTIGGNPRYPVRLYHVHRLTWRSSNGNLPSLARVGTRERVTHRTNPAGSLLSKTISLMTDRYPMAAIPNPSLKPL